MRLAALHCEEGLGAFANLFNLVEKTTNRNAQWFFQQPANVPVLQLLAATAESHYSMGLRFFRVKLKVQLHFQVHCPNGIAREWRRSLGKN